MPASFPSSIRSFTSKVDLVDTVLADHVNALQDEVRALEIAMGISVLRSTYTGTFVRATDWNSLDSRLANIETGLVNGTDDSPFFRKAGDTIQAPAGTVGVAMKSSQGNLADLQQNVAPNNAMGFRTDYLGIPYVANNPILYTGNTEYTTIKDDIEALKAAVSRPTIDPFLLAGL